MAEYELIASKGCGSAVIEMALALAGLPHRITLIPYLEPGPQRDRLLALNPLGQVPTLVLPDGTVMTESAAMVLHIDDVAPQARLAPRPDDSNRAAFLNLLVVLVGALYPTFTFGDDPKQFGLDENAASVLRAQTDARRMRLWQHLESRISPDPYVLGRERSAIDLYVAVMTHWRPGSAWFAEHCPKLLAAAEATAADPRIGEILSRNM
ncbi:glutathione S-transferase family protein [Microvirga thermotolerans]|uniref:Glutathione S-transferase n=1 Tax=Microvirga thermotolerans TaxID=2651334 RepID=A0A5P9JZ29_9HYPH|nr:glutathione S-transferase family protein [Microvirga thermotolerans]QFU17509.1 glutathione S-transferase [Microvirga thermotolerans]